MENHSIAMLHSRATSWLFAVTILLTAFSGTAKAYLEVKPIDLPRPLIYDHQNEATFDNNSSTNASTDLNFGVSKIQSSLLKRESECGLFQHPCADGIHCANLSQVCCPDDNGYACLLSEKCCIKSGKCAPILGTCCGTGACGSFSSCCNGSGCTDMNHKCCGKDKQCPFGYECCVDEDGNITCAQQCFPSLIFPYLPGFLDEIYENMCRWTSASRTTQDPHSAILTLSYQTGRNLTRAKAMNRRLAKCAGPNRTRCPAGTSCDQFPFSSTLEGGIGPQAACVPIWQNNAFQAVYYNLWVSEMLNSGKLTRGERFRVKLSNINCTTFRRQDAPTAGKNPVLSRADNVTVLSSSIFGNLSNGSNALAIVLSESQDTKGRYNFNYSVSSGSILSGAIIDDDGEPLHTFGSLAVGASGNVTIDVEEDYGGLTFLGWTKDTNISVSHDIKFTPSTTSSSSATASTKSSTSTIPAPRATTSTNVKNAACRVGGPSMGRIGLYIAAFMLFIVTVLS